MIRALARALARSAPVGHLVELLEGPAPRGIPGGHAIYHCRLTWLPRRHGDAMVIGTTCGFCKRLFWFPFAISKVYVHLGSCTAKRADPR